MYYTYCIQLLREYMMQNEITGYSLDINPTYGGSEPPEQPGVHPVQYILDLGGRRHISGLDILDISRPYRTATYRRRASATADPAVQYSTQVVTVNWRAVKLPIALSRLIIAVGRPRMPVQRWHLLWNSRQLSAFS